MKGMTVRLAVEADYPQLQILLAQLNPDDPPLPKTAAETFRQILAAEHLQLIVAEAETAAGNRLVASCYLNILPNLTRGGRSYGVIENVVTDAGYRQQGLGQAVISKAVDLAWEAGCYKVMLMSGRSDAAVHKFYRSCGFDGDSKQAYIMRAPG